MAKALNIKPKSGEVGIYLKQVDGRMMACTAGGEILAGQVAVEYRTGVDEIETATIKLHLCGILEDGQ